MSKTVLIHHSVDDVNVLFFSSFFSPRLQFSTTQASSRPIPRIQGNQDRHQLDIMPALDQTQKRTWRISLEWRSLILTF